MVIPDPGILMQAAGAIKNGVDALKNGIELVRTIAGATTGSAEQKKVLEQTLATASSSAAFAEAEPVGTRLGVGDEVGTFELNFACGEPVTFDWYARARDGSGWLERSARASS